MDANKSVTANFAQPGFDLTTNPSPIGGGTVTGGGTYASGTYVTVNAVPAAGYGFANWSGDCSGTGTCSVTMNADKSVTANFEKAFTLTATPVPSAGGTVTGGGVYVSGADVTVSATTNSGYTFARWSGDCSGTGTCSLTMNADKTVTAHFEKGFILAITAIPAAGGSLNGGGTYTPNTTAEVTEVASAG